MYELTLYTIGTIVCTQFVYIKVAIFTPDIYKMDTTIRTILALQLWIQAQCVCVSVVCTIVCIQFMHLRAATFLLDIHKMESIWWTETTALSSSSPIPPSSSENQFSYHYAQGGGGGVGRRQRHLERTHHHHHHRLRSSSSSSTSSWENEHGCWQGRGASMEVWAEVECWFWFMVCYYLILPVIYFCIVIQWREQNYCEDWLADTESSCWEIDSTPYRLSCRSW